MNIITESFEEQRCSHNFFCIVIFSVYLIINIHQSIRWSRPLLGQTFNINIPVFVRHGEGHSSIGKADIFKDAAVFVPIERLYKAIGSNHITVIFYYFLRKFFTDLYHLSRPPSHTLASVPLLFRLLSVLHGNSVIAKGIEGEFA